MIARGVNTAWAMSLRRAERRFAQALRTPARAQRDLLFAVLARHRATDFGRAHRFDRIRSVEDYRARVPVGDSASHAPYIDRLRAGNTNTLTADPVTHLIPTSGSLGPRKLIPYTRPLQAQFDAALRPWVRDLFRRYPTAAAGRAYWSISPAIPEDNASVIPIGFQDDTDYLSPLGRVLVRRILAVPSEVRHLADEDAFWQATARHLLATEDLSLISVWHPSYLDRLLDEIESRWHSLLDQLPPQRARQLRQSRPDAIREVWPRLALVSAWADASAALGFERLRDRLGGIGYQPKGLLATECWTTIPYRGRLPLAVNSHFFEFLADDGQTFCCDELAVGQTYETIVTTAGGLYRYRTGDRVRITGRLDATPTLQLLGRDRATCDLCGEKLHETHVNACLQQLFTDTGYRPKDQALAPADAAAPTRYVLHLAGPSPPPSSLLVSLDQALCDNPHYALARRLGQLDAATLAWQPTPFRSLDTHGSTPIGAHKPGVLVSHQTAQTFHTPHGLEPRV